MEWANYFTDEFERRFGGQVNSSSHTPVIVKRTRDEQIALLQFKLIKLFANMGYNSLTIFDGSVPKGLEFKLDLNRTNYLRDQRETVFEKLASLGFLDADIGETYFDGLYLNKKGSSDPVLLKYDGETIPRTALCYSTLNESTFSFIYGP